MFELKNKKEAATGRSERRVATAQSARGQAGTEEGKEVKKPDHVRTL